MIAFPNELPLVRLGWRLSRVRTHRLLRSLASAARKAGYPQCGSPNVAQSVTEYLGEQ